MPCLAVRRWTFSDLVGAFLDLSVAYLLLCASALAYFASKFLGLFGLNLPCACNGFFAIPGDDNNCLQRQILDYPLKKISSIQSSVKNKFPFDSIGNHSQWKSNLEKDYMNNVRNASVGSEGESSCISSSERRAENSAERDLAEMKEKGFVMGALNFQDVKERKFECKWKRLPRHRSRNNLRRRGKVAVDNGRLSKVSSFKSVWSDAETPQPAPDRIRDETSNGVKDPVNSRGSVVDIGTKRKISQGFELCESVDENEITDHENASDLDGNARNTIRLLELALEEEHAARAVLYIELEKERSAAATAADEAMAMILRLQKEKASLEMEARQCQRMVEEKYAYDAEEMNILKEILIRREREKYFLEKEVEAYRQEIFNDVDNTYGFCYSSDDDSGLMMPQKRRDSIGWKYNKAEKETFTRDDDCSSTHGDIEAHSSISDEENVQQKTSETNSSAQNSHQKAADNGSKCIIQDVHVTDDQSSRSKQVTEATSTTTTETGNNSSTIPSGLPPLQKAADKGSECIIQDVHVIDDQSSQSKQVTEATSTTTTETGNNSSTIPSGLPPLDPRSRSIRSDMRRKSMSAFDTERYKIDNEITWLREKLKIVQEGREKLKFSKGNEEREKIQLQILEDITGQLREIRQLTEPGKAVRRASLPLPLTSNVMSKKRRWRSGPLLLEGSI